MKYVNIIVAIIAVGNVIYSFIEPKESPSIFTLEVNIWVYRLFWILIAVSCIFGYLNNKSKKK